MYFVDRRKIEETLQYMEKMMTYLQKETSFQTDLERLALERLAHVLIEAIIDVGNAMIDGFIMRDPGSYEDIIDILTDEKVIRPEEAKQLKAIVQHRKNLVQQYIHVSHEQLLSILRENLAALQSFPNAVRTYLHNELGPVSAFRN
ncbi:uncharacterized protein YutE (UPF0331/DUF86 family) [Thermolongibacillus altinsuensis]|uniref:Uncharacterized protein YutE (UPF0331/DUF86 family) n=1 Tax=Thermolongibacillus altinsuensis TaxID=575256 RepID=A0A4R1QLQ5_9BACL|nr:DUF86 domain-containing protein [Thermolongibacillus altinsuensis]TCL47342.1 uncharacterized protein YutE (UPF0331/DUF86 family) [Thermolongibacillus altinsuensis]